MITKVLEDVGRGDIDVVGVGGVATGKDAFELILCGGNAVCVYMYIYVFMRKHTYMLMYV